MTEAWSKRKGKKRQRTDDEKALEHFNSAGTSFPTDLTVSQLRLALKVKGVAEADYKNLKKQDLVQKLVSVAPPPSITDALNVRTTKRKHTAEPVIARVGNTVLVLICSFLDQFAHCAFARSCSFMRIRLTLSLVGVPSPGLVSLHTLQHNFNATDQQLIFMRTKRLQSLRATFKKGVQHPLPASLTRISLISSRSIRNERVFQHGEELRGCTQLQELELFGATLAPKTPLHFPALRRLHINNVPVLPTIVNHSTLQRLELSHVHIDPVRWRSQCPLWPCLTHLEIYLCTIPDLIGPRLEFHTLTALQHLSVLMSMGATLAQLPPSLTSLECDPAQALISFSPKPVPSLRTLSIRCTAPFFDDQDQMRVCKALVLCPSLESLTIRGLQTDLRRLVPDVCKQLRKANVVPSNTQRHTH